MSYDRFFNYSEKYQYFQNPGCSGFPEKPAGSRIRNFFGLKPSRDQDGANKKKFSQISPAVLEEIGRNHTHTQSIKNVWTALRNGNVHGVGKNNLLSIYSVLQGRSKKLRMKCRQ